MLFHLYAVCMEAEDHYRAGDDAPIIQYANFIQKLMAICTDVVYDRSAGLTAKVEILTALIDNFPPEGKEAMKEDYNLLSRYESAPSSIRNVEQLKRIYGTAHNWIYLHILQDAFKIRPVFRQSGTLAEGKRYSENKGLGQNAGATN